MKRITHYIVAIILILTMVLSGCGGGNGGGPSTPPGGGDPSNQPPGGSLTAPQNVNVAAADTQLTVGWDTVAGATSYLVWCGNTNDTGTAGKSSYETAATSYTITGLSNDNIYYIFVQAKNSAGVSVPSSLRNGTPFHSTTAPTAPGTPDLIPGNGQLTVKWDAVTGATYYDVYYSTGSSPPANPAQENITIASCTITGLINGTTYYVWVKAKNNIGSSDFSPEASGTPIAPPTLTAGDRQITVNWNAVTGATSYQVWYGTSSDISAANQYGIDITSGTSCTITGLNAGTTYYVWVKAKNSSGESVFSPSANIKPYISIGEIAGGSGPCADGAWISFGKTFSTIPVVVVNAYDSNRKPLIAGVKTEANSPTTTTTGFNIKIHNVDGAPVKSGATVQWVAIIPNFSGQVQVQSGYGLYDDGDVVKFANAFTLPSPNLFHYPFVICSAYEECDLYDKPTQKPIMAAPYNIDSNRFYVSLKDANGISSKAYLTYIALVRPPDYNYYHEVAMVSGYDMYNNYVDGGVLKRSVTFDLTQDADVVICSAQKDTFAYAVAAYDTSRIGFKLGILDYQGYQGSYVWTSWLALGFK